MDKMRELLPCPWRREICGTPYRCSQKHEGKNVFFMKCPCGCRGPFSPTEDGCIKAWNTRVTHKEPEGMREEVASQIYDAMRWAVNQMPGCKGVLLPNWQAGGNSFAQQKAREVAAVALQYQPSERSGEMYFGHRPRPSEAERSEKHSQLTAHLPPLLENGSIWMWTDDEIEILRAACAKRFDETLRTESLFCIASTGIRIAKAKAATAPSRVRLPSEDEFMGKMQPIRARQHHQQAFDNGLLTAYRTLLTALDTQAGGK